MTADRLAAAEQRLDEANRALKSIDRIAHAASHAIKAAEADIANHRQKCEAEGGKAHHEHRDLVSTR